MKWDGGVLQGRYRKDMRILPRWAAIMAAVWLFVPGTDAAPELTSFERGREEAMEATVTAFCQEVEALKPRFPELAGFGDPVCMQRGAGWVFYDASKQGDAAKSETPKGLLMRLSLIEAEELPSTLHLAFPTKSIGGANTGVTGRLDVGGSPELKEAVNTVYMNVRRRVLEPGLANVVLNHAGVPADLDGRLTSAELAMGGGRWADEVVPEAPYQANFRTTLAQRIFVAARGVTFSAAQQERVFTALCERRYPPGAWAEAIAVMREQGGGLWPERSLEIVCMLVAAEREGADTFESTPFFGSSWVSVARSAREALAEEIRLSSDVRFQPTALFLIENDPVASHRLGALGGAENMSTLEAEGLIGAGLANGFRSVVVAATRLAVKPFSKKILGALQNLAQSPVVRVREAAAKALREAGDKAPVMPKEFSLPESARGMIATLRGLGLDDALILEVLSRPETTHVVPRTRGENAAQVRRLDDPWRISVLNPVSLRQRAAQYHDGFGLDFGACRIDPTGPFLLVAAAQADIETQRVIYERMGEEFESDDEALLRGIDYLAWSIFLQGIEAFQQANDGKAHQAFKRLDKFTPHASPHSALSVWLQQSRTLITEIQRRGMLVKSPEPPVTTELAYWMEKIPEINGFQQSQPGAPLIWERNNRATADYRPVIPFASDRLRALGRAALPALVTAVDDPTPTRTIGYWRDYDPSRYWITKGQAAQLIIRAICDDEKLKPPFEGPYRGNPEKLSEVWSAWLTGLQATGDVPASVKIDLSECHGPYRIQSFVKVAAALQAMSAPERVAQLRTWAGASRGDLSSYFREEQVFLLCGMLFDKIPGGEFRPAGRGVPAFIGKGGYTLTRSKIAELWPDEPFVFVDDVPFQITRGYSLAGVGESSAHFLDRCLKDARWTARDFALVKEADLPKALARLLSDYSDPALLNADDKRFLSDQTKPYAIPGLSSGVRIVRGQQSEQVSTTKDGYRLGPLDQLWVTIYGGVRPYRYVLRSEREGVSTTLGMGTGESEPANPFESQMFPVPWQNPIRNSLFVFEVEDVKGARLTQRIKVIDAHNAEVYAPLVAR